jgi:hypothetical protein
MSGGKGGVKSIGFGGPKHITFNIKHPQKLSNQPSGIPEGDESSNPALTRRRSGWVDVREEKTTLKALDQLGHRGGVIKCHAKICAGIQPLQG